MKPLGACHGFEIRSDLAFQTLRAGGGLPMRVEEEQLGLTDPEGDLIAEWHPRRNNPFHGRLLAAGHRYAFWASDAGWYRIDPVAHSIVVPAGDTLRRELRMLGVPTTLCVLETGALSIHAAAVEIDGRAVLLAGPGRHGKTTLAAGFARAGYRLLSDDTSCCRPGRPPRVFPGPAVLRLRRDVADHFGDSSVVRVTTEDTADRAYFLLSDDARGSGDPLPLAAIVLLKTAGDGPRLRTVAPARAIPDLWAVTSHLPTDESRADCFAKLAALVTQTDVIELERPLSIEGLGEVIDLVATHMVVG
jgi:hypothetical protein